MAKSRTVLKADNNSSFTTNGNQEISGQIHNSFNEDVLDSHYNKLDEKAWVENQAYSTTKSYAAGDICSIETRMMQCIAPTSGSFDPSKWIDLDHIETNLGPLAALTVAANQIDLQDSPTPELEIAGSGAITVTTIVNGLAGLKYRLYPAAGITNLTITDTAVATVISNGTGEVSNGTGIAATGLVGRADREMSDYVEVICGSDAGGTKEYNAIIKVVKHT